MALEIYWTEEAKEGLDEIIAYLEEHWTERQLRNFFLRLNECISNITKSPSSQKDSLRKPGTKEYQHSAQTTIFYCYDQNGIYILKVWSNRQDPGKL